MIIIKGEYEFALNVDGIDLALGENLLESFLMIEAVMDAVPVCKIVLRDIPEEINSVGLFDGSRVTVSVRVLNAAGGRNIIIPFRIFQIEVEPETHSDKVQLWCYYDAPDYLKDAGFEFIDGTSSDAAAAIARKSGLRVDVDQSADSQVWIRQGMTGYAFLQKVARSAYLNDRSAYAVAVTREGQLRYYNVGGRLSRKPVWKMRTSDSDADQLGDDELHIDSYVTRIDSGLMNRFSGYGILSKEFDITTGVDGTPSDVALTNLEKSTEKLQINSELTKPPRYEGSPWTLGNTHPKYVQATLQNKRILSTFSTNQKISSTTQRDVHLLDRVELQVHANSPERGKFRDFMNGLYFVDRIATHVTPQDVKFKFNLTREGYNPQRSIGQLL